MEATEFYRKQAQQCREDAGRCSDGRMQRDLVQLADHYEAEARRLTNDDPLASRH